MPTLLAPLPALVLPACEQFVRKFFLYGERVGGLSVMCEDAQQLWPRTGAIASNNSPQLLQPA